ncbi:MAG TPA: hypothetical protein VHL57_05815, partial [Flavobacteriales bacterium]|nr:hypothetical protein [Flavobacteriales bacterium]
YFNIAAKAKDQRAEAIASKSEAGTSRTLASALEQQVVALRADTAAANSPERKDQLQRLEERRAQLKSRADSLSQRADLLERAAGVNESQAALVLQTLPSDRSSAIMALEQRARRNGPELAQVPAPAQEQPKPTNATAQPADSLASARTERPAAGNTQRPASAITTPATTARPEGTTAEAQPTTRTEVAPARTTERPAMAQPTRTLPTPNSGAAPGGLPATLPALTADVFSMEPGTTRQGAIPIDAPMPAGVVFKVQVGAFRNAVSDQAFQDMTPVTGETVGNGLTRYTAGMFTNAASAVKASEQVRARGYRDAFVVAYQDGRRIPVAQAMALVSPATAQAPPAVERPASTVQPASQLPSINSAGTDDAAVLNNYAASAQEVLASFKPSAEATAYYNDPSAAPANQVETIKGLFFTVQVGVYSKPTALDKLFNITPLNSERTENNKIRYTTGVFLDLESARVRKDGTVTLGVKDAFITAYLNGKRIPMRDARALLAKFGNAILADPSTLKR